MMKKIFYIIIGCFSMMSVLIGCSSDEAITYEPNKMIFDILHPSVIANSKALSRASETAFEKDDNVGVYISTHGSPLQLAGNYTNNEKIIYDGSSWTPARTIYWDNGKYDVFAYYPYLSSISSIEDLPFSVATDQTTTKSGTTLGGYEASDFLFAIDTAVVASNGAVKLQFKHRMSKLLVRLIKGEDYEGDLPDDAEVYIHNTVTSATIDLNLGVVTRNQYGSTQSIKAKPMGSHQYAAIIVPQRISYSLPLIEVVAKGVSYLYETSFVFKAGVQHTISLVIDKNPEQVKIDLGGEIENWK
jgi:hypothetical protein